MTQHTGIVKTIDAKASANGKSYWKITWQDGQFDNIFNSDWMPALLSSRDTGRMVDFTREPTPDGKFKNIKSVALAALPAAAATIPRNEPKPPQSTQGTVLPPPGGIIQPAKEEMTKTDWAEKDKITRKSIERQTALNAAIELAKLTIVKQPEKVNSENIVLTAKYFEAYLAGEEVKPAKTTLVDEAKKLGATEVKKGETKT